MKRILILILALLFIIPFQTSADDKSDEQKRVDALNTAIKSVVKIHPKSGTIMTDTERGTGFFIGKNTILTNWHVVNQGYPLEVTRYDGTICTGNVRERDEWVDLAMVKVDCEGEPLNLADSIQLGQDAFAIGNVLIDFALTRGIVVKLFDRGETVTDAHAAPGSSGGPMLDSTGKVIGVIVARLKADVNFIYAVPLDNVKKFLQGAGQL